LSLVPSSHHGTSAADHVYARELRGLREAGSPVGGVSLVR
jgi:hypothetical protein